MQTTIILPRKRANAWRFPKPSIDFSLATGTALTCILFLYSGPLLRTLDASAAALDPGMLSPLLLALLAFFAFSRVGLWLLGLLWPVFRDYRKHHFTANFRSLQPWQKLAFYMAGFFFLLYALVACLVAVI